MTSSNELRMGIVGLGIGKANARAIVANPRGRVTALCDIIEEKMPAFASELPEPTKHYVDYRDMCQDPDLDAIFVGTPNQLHVPVALEAVRAGKHVLCTKPLSDSVETAKQLVEEAETAGVVNMMSLGIRYSDPVLYLGKLREQGGLGEVYYAHAQSLRRSGIPDWNLGFVQEGGGAFRDMGVHVIDSAWWLMGKPKPISVMGVSGAKFGPRGQGYWDFRQPEPAYYREFVADDYGGGLVRFENGAGLQVESLWACHGKQTGETQIKLFGTEGGAQLRPLTVYHTVNGAPQDTEIEVPNGPPGFGYVANHFVECVLDGVECQAPLRHGLIVQQMMEGLLESARLGHEIRLD